MLLGIERKWLALAPAGWRRGEIAGWLLDGAIAAVLALSIPAGPWMGFLPRLFAPLMLIAMVRLLPRLVERPWARWITDRLLLAIVLAAAAAAGFVHQAIYALALAYAGLAVIFSRDPSKLTPV
jgi:hypothetical protein